MPNFVSKWKIPDDKSTDIANLTYPHTVKDINGDTVSTIATVEDAEALLDWYKGNYDHAMITQKLIKGSTAERKLRGAAERKRYLANKAERDKARAAQFEAEEISRLQSREDRRAARLNKRYELDLAIWEPQKNKERDELVANIMRLARDLTKVQAGVSRDAYARIGDIASALGTTVGTLRQHHFGVTTSKRYGMILDRDKATTPARKNTPNKVPR